MNIREHSGFTLLAICAALCGCATTEESAPANANDNMDAVLWQQASAEYAGVTKGVYAAASAALVEIAMTESAGDKGKAIVMDVDETVLDNVPYQAQLVLDGATYGSESWDEWIALRSAPPVPGAVEFIREAQSLGLHVVFVTNRRCRTRPGGDDECPQKADTRANLEDVGIDTRSTTLFLRGERPPEPCLPLLTAAEEGDGTWSSDKTSRRECIQLSDDIVMLFGDQLGDFTEHEDMPSGTARRDVANEYSEYWGRVWFMLPNPTYGSWRPGTYNEKQQRIRGTD